MKCEFLSASGAETYEECPKRFHAKYEDKIRFAASNAMGAGLVTHKALELYYNPIEDVSAEDAFDKALATEECRAEEGIDESRRMFLDVIAIEKKEDLNIVGTEVEFKLFTPNGAASRGMIDRIDMPQDGVIQIVDYKTGNYVPHMEELITSHQARLYPLWIYMSGDFSDINKVTFRYLYTKTCESKTLPPVTREMSMKYMVYFEHLFGAIRRNENPQPSPNQFCWNCECRGGCPEYTNIMKTAIALGISDDMFNMPEGYTANSSMTLEKMAEVYERLSLAGSIIDREKKNAGSRLVNAMAHSGMTGQVMNDKSVKLVKKKFRTCKKESMMDLIKTHGLESRALERISSIDMEAIVKGNLQAMKGLEQISTMSESAPYPMIRKLKTSKGGVSEVDQEA
jgi:hypothetical protein